MAKFSLDGEAMSEKGETKLAYGCIFCVTGKELAVARHIEQTCDDVRVVVARQIIRKSVQGKTHTEETILFRGYIFFEAPEHKEPIRRFTNENIISVLTSETGDWRLYGNDAKLAQWLFSCDGVLSLSKAYQEGDRIRISSGPLKDLEGWILRIVKRDRSAQVAVPFCNRVAKIWLGFEIVEKI